MRMLSAAACARPHPRRHKPSSVGTPSAAVKLPSDPPPVCDSSSSTPQLARQHPRHAEQRAIPAERSIGRPVQTAAHFGRCTAGHTASTSRNLFSSPGASFRRRTPDIDLRSGFGGHHIGARAPRNHPRIDRDATHQFGEPGDKVDLPRQFQHRAGAGLKVHARVRGLSAHHHGEIRPRPLRAVLSLALRVPSPAPKPAPPFCRAAFFSVSAPRRFAPHFFIEFNAGSTLEPTGISSSASRAPRK